MSPSCARREWNRDEGGHVWTEHLRSDVPRRGGAGTLRTEPKEMGAGGPQRVAAWDGAQGARTRRSASLPFVLAGPDLSGTLQGVDGAAGANHINAFGANGNVQLDADCMANTDKWPAKRKSSENGVVRFRWEHSDFKNVAYFFVYKLFDKLIGTEGRHVVE